MADANPCPMEGRMTECNTMKRPGKPDTGNPFVRFDEGRGGDTELTTAVCLICHSPLRLLYRSGGLKSALRPQSLAGVARARGGDLLRRAFRDQMAAFFSGFRAEI